MAPRKRKMKGSHEVARHPMELRSKRIKQGATGLIPAASQSAVAHKQQKHITELPMEIQRMILGHVLLDSEVFVGAENGDLDLRPTKEILNEDYLDKAWHWPDRCAWQSAAGAFDIWRGILSNSEKQHFYENCRLVFHKAKYFVNFTHSMTAAQHKIVRAIEIRPLAAECWYSYSPTVQDLKIEEMWRAGILHFLKHMRSAYMAFAATSAMGPGAGTINSLPLHFSRWYLTIQSDPIETWVPRLESEFADYSEFQFENGTFTQIDRARIHRYSGGYSGGLLARFRVKPIVQVYPPWMSVPTLWTKYFGDPIRPQTGSANPTQ